MDVAIWYDDKDKLCAHYTIGKVTMFIIVK